MPNLLGWKVCIVLSLLTFETAMACYGGGAGGEDTENKEITKKERPETNHDVDSRPTIDLSNVSDIVERNIQTAWDGWVPSNETQKEWSNWYDEYREKNAKNQDFVPGKSGAQNFSAERGPGSGWPDLPGWADLGEGNGGSAIPPWAYEPIYTGKNTMCYQPPIKGKCPRSDPKETEPSPVDRWGYNPYLDECQVYKWSTCGGSRNKFIDKKTCDTYCIGTPPSSCS